MFWIAAKSALIFVCANLPSIWSVKNWASVQLWRYLAIWRAAPISAGVALGFPRIFSTSSFSGISRISSAVIFGIAKCFSECRMLHGLAFWPRSWDCGGAFLPPNLVSVFGFWLPAWPDDPS